VTIFTTKIIFCRSRGNFYD